MAIAIDPVCGMEVDTQATDLKVDHEGTSPNSIKPNTMPNGIIEYSYGANADIGASA